MNIVNDKSVKVFLKDYQGKELYSVGISKKDQNGNYINGYISCRFKKDVHLKNKSTIKIKNAWLDFYLKDKETRPYIFINEFELVSEDVPIQENKEIKKDPYEEMGDEVELTDEDLPFDFGE